MIMREIERDIEYTGDSGICNTFFSTRQFQLVKWFFVTMYFYNLQVDILLVKMRQIVLTDASPSDRRRRKILPHNTETRERNKSKK